MDHIITSLLKNTLSSRCCFKLLPRVIPESMLLVVSLLLALIQVVVMIYSVVSFLILWHVDVHGAQPNLSNPLSREVHSFLGFLVQTHKSTNFFKNSIAFNFFFFSFFFFSFFFNYSVVFVGSWMNKLSAANCSLLLLFPLSLPNLQTKPINLVSVIYGQWYIQGQP